MAGARTTTTSIVGQSGDFIPDAPPPFSADTVQPLSYPLGQNTRPYDNRVQEEIISMTITQEFEALYSAEYDAVTRKVAKRLRPSDDLEAVVADAFAQLWTSMAEGKASNPRALLFLIADRRAVDESRRREYAEDMIERLGVSDSRIRAMQGEFYAHKQRDTRGWSDSDDEGWGTTW